MLSPEAELSASDLLLNFESLGDNCEFGLVQRFCGAEPLGLFRFSYTDLGALVDAMAAGFVHLGGADDLTVYPGPHPAIFCRSKRYGFTYHTGDVVTKTSPETLLPQEVKRVEYLKSRLLMDLRDGEKIFVRKGSAAEEPALPALVAELRKRGQNTLLWVVAADGSRAPGHVEMLEPGLLKAHVARYAPYGDAQDLDLESWLDVCRNAYRLWRGLPPDAAAPPRQPALKAGVENLSPARGAAAPAHPDGAVLAHGLGASEGSDGRVLAELTSRTGLRGGGIYVASADVWIPDGFQGSRVTAVGSKGLRYGARDADLSRRNCWQRIWVATRAAKWQRSLSVSLVAHGTGDATLYSAGWRLEEGPVPSIRPVIPSAAP